MSHREALDVSTRKHLLFDDGLTLEKKGFELTMNPAVRTDEPVLLPDRPWEVGGMAGLGGIVGDSNMSVLEDGGLYKLWYVIPHPQAEAERNLDLSPAEMEGMDAKMLADLRAEARFVLCYATSEDGLHWEKPDLGLFKYEGSANNNMIFAGRLGCTVFKDPTAEPEAKYKMIAGAGPRIPHVHPHHDIPTKNIYHAIYGACSSDGIHWHTYDEPIIPWYTDTTNVCYWDDRIGKYVAFVRWNEDMIYEDGKTISLTGGRFTYRAIGRTESEDFRSFPPPVKIMEPTPEEREPYETGLDYYNTSAVKYPFAADSYFLFSSNFYHEPDTLDVHLATSRDGVHYNRWQNPFVGLGQPDAFDSKCVYMATGMIRKGHELWMYYAGYDHAHGRYYERGPRSGAVGMVRIRLDGFVSQDAGWSGGNLMTVPLNFDGSRLQVNMDANAGGSLKVELLDEAKKPIPGHTKEDADALWGNDVQKTVTWNGQSDVSALRGKTVHLNFIGRGVKLYAFQFVS